MVSQIDYNAAVERGKQTIAHGVAKSAAYRDGRLLVELNTGIGVAIPVSMIEGLSGASEAQLHEVEVLPSGIGLHWESLDADVHVPSLLSGLYGSQAWMAKVLGARGGKVSSKVKAAAARTNDKKGGRPKKQVSR